MFRVLPACEGPECAEHDAAAADQVARDAIEWDSLVTIHVSEAFERALRFRGYEQTAAAKWRPRPAVLSIDFNPDVAAVAQVHWPGVGPIAQAAFEGGSCQIPLPAGPAEVFVGTPSGEVLAHEVISMTAGMAVQIDASIAAD